MATTTGQASPTGRPVQQAGGSRMSQLLAALDTVQVNDQHDLYALLEAFQMIGHRLAVEAMMAGTTLEEGAKAAARQRSEFGMVGFDVRRKIKRTVKGFTTMANAFATAAGSAQAVWKTFEKDFGDELAPTKTPKRAPKGFSITPN